MSLLDHLSYAWASPASLASSTLARVCVVGTAIIPVIHTRSMPGMLLWIPMLRPREGLDPNWRKHK